MYWLSRRAIFAVLAGLAVAWAIVGTLRREGFWDDVWAQLFWLTVAIIVITFVLESLLTRELETRRRAEDAFAFRTFVGALLDRLGAIAEPPVGVESGHGSVRQAALASAEEFAEAAEAMAATLRNTVTIDAQVYYEVYLDVGNGVRALAHNYIRIFSASRTEMVDRYGQLIELASRWQYEDALRPQARAFTASLPADDPNGRHRREEERRAEAAVVGLVRETSDLVADLARRATKPGVRAAPR